MHKPTDQRQATLPATGYRWRIPAVAALAETGRAIWGSVRPRRVPYVVLHLAWLLRAATTQSEVEAVKEQIVSAKARELFCKRGLELLKAEYAAAIQRTRSPQIATQREKVEA